jgi:membrane fusion protein (multidrug efflux system)
VGTDEKGDRVVYLEKDGLARAQAVKTGLSDLRHVEITEGLKPMNLVIVSYGQELKDGTPVVQEQEKQKMPVKKGVMNPH